MSSQQPPLMDANPAADNVVHAAAHRRQVIRRHVASWARWLHIYLSMASFAILFFFAATGLTLNHAERFSAAPRIAQLKGQVETKWIKKRRRANGLMLAGVCAVACYLIYLFLIP